MSIGVFLIIILSLIGVLLFARKKLTPAGNVKLSINGDEPLEVSPGSTILSTLSNQNIFLPSACGGGGTCGMCKCQVTEGGGSILPTETGFFTRKEQQSNWRLGCQVKIRNDMKIHVPEEIMGIKKWECEVVSNRNVATFIKEFVVRLPEGETLNFHSGGYIQIDVPKVEVDFKGMEVEPQF
ncbi:MAG: 2Fe-2S iron-sulfur cluster binding domain-containing protein [Bacteroidales bacterium]|nr:2Fe-2S iron-sulfur cluster binding domain-containing protein [Bacteroidales bacterium]